MEIREVLKNLRNKYQLTQEELAVRVLATRQAISRWETGETQPNTDILELLSKKFSISINTLLGLPHQSICQCCGMSLAEDEVISRETDGNFNEDYCKQCYVDDAFVHTTKNSLLDYLVTNIPNPDNFSGEERCLQLGAYLSQLKYWK